MKGITVLVFALALAATALLAACGGGNGGSSVGPSGSVGPDTGIAFSGKDPDKPTPKVYVVDADSGAVQELTNIEQYEWWPTWSRDRQRLAFVAWPVPTPAPTATTPTPSGTTPTPTPAPTPNPSGITPTPTPAPTPNPEEIIQRHLLVANADGSDQHPIADSIPLQNYSGGFSWSPDGGRIISMAVVDPAEQAIRSELRLFNTADGSEVPFPEQRLGFLPAWSPDGTKIVFGAFVGELDERGKGESELFMMDSDGANLRQITGRPGTDVEPSWSPDGTRILWWGQNPQTDPSQTPTPILFMMDVASGQITELGEGSVPVWSPDGQRILFVLEEKPPPGVLPSRANTDIYALDVATGERMPLVQDPSSDLWPVWSPDGQRIAFVSERDSLAGEIYIVNADGSDLRRLTNNNVVEGMLAWAPR